MSLIIGFGHRARQGKDEAVAHLIKTYGGRYDVRRYAFADMLKEQWYDLLLQPCHPYWSSEVAAQTVAYGLMPVPLIPIDCATSAEKLAWIAENKTWFGKHLQVFASEYIRAEDEFYYVNALRYRVEADKPQIALVTDVRFLNEFWWIKSSQGYTVKVTREGYTVNDGRDPNHAGEVALINSKFDFEIRVADGDLDGLRSDAETVFQAVVEKVTGTFISDEEEEPSWVL
jgi:hypothetical protein